MPIPTKPQTVGIEMFDPRFAEASTSTYLKAKLQSGVLMNPLYAVSRLTRSFMFGDEDSDMWLDKTQASKMAMDSGLRDVQIPDAGMDARRLYDIIDAKKAEERRNLVLENNRAGLIAGTAGLGLEMLATVADPVSLATMYIPVVPGALKWVTSARTFGQAALRRAVVGAVEGAVGAALVEPLVLSASMREQLDYTFASALQNVAFGSIFGAGLHVGVGAVGDRIGFTQRSRVTRKQRLREQAAARNMAMSDALYDRPIQSHEAVLATRPEYNEYRVGGKYNRDSVDFETYLVDRKIDYDALDDDMRFEIEREYVNEMVEAPIQARLMDLDAEMQRVSERSGGDIISEARKQNGIADTPDLPERVRSEHPQLIRKKGGVSLDEMASRLKAKGMGDGTVDTMLELMDEAATARMSSASDMQALALERHTLDNVLRSYQTDDYIAQRLALRSMTDAERAQVGARMLDETQAQSLYADLPPIDDIQIRTPEQLAAEQSEDLAKMRKQLERQEFPLEQLDEEIKKIETEYQMADTAIDTAMTCLMRSGNV